MVQIVEFKKMVQIVSALMCLEFGTIQNCDLKFTIVESHFIYLSCLIGEIVSLEFRAWILFVCLNHNLLEPGRSTMGCKARLIKYLTQLLSHRLERQARQ